MPLPSLSLCILFIIVCVQLQGASIDDSHYCHPSPSASPDSRNISIHSSPRWWRRAKLNSRSSTVAPPEDPARPIEVRAEKADDANEDRDVLDSNASTAASTAFTNPSSAASIEAGKRYESTLARDSPWHASHDDRGKNYAAPAAANQLRATRSCAIWSPPSLPTAFRRESSNCNAPSPHES